MGDQCCTTRSPFAHSNTCSNGTGGPQTIVSGYTEKIGQIVVAETVVTTEHWQAFSVET
jgi:hypothetical protein